jgi:thymidylate kinase
VNIGDPLDRLVERIEAMRVSRLLRVAIDGPDAAGKTTLADALAGVLGARGRDVIRMSIAEEVLRRALKRDVALSGSKDEVRRRYRARYLPAQRHYLAAVRPLELADVVIDNDDPENPTLRG